MPSVRKTDDRKKSGRKLRGLSDTAKRMLEILDAVGYGLEILDVIARSSRFREPPTIEGAKMIIAARERRAYRDQIRRMRHEELLKIRTRNGRLEHILTQKGRELHMKLGLKAAGPRSDGKKTVVTYDIPETARRGRSAFRHFLKSCGFRMLQYSVWITEKDVYDGMRSWVRAQKLGKWVKIMLV